MLPPRRPVHDQKYGVFTYFNLTLILVSCIGNRRRMRSSLHTEKYALFLDELKALRSQAGLSQKQLAEILGIGQDLISRSESGGRRVDVFELTLWAHACGTTLEAFARRLDERIRSNQFPELLGCNGTQPKN